MSRSRTLQLGLNGLIPGWEEAYRPALDRLSGRVAVRAVHHLLPREGLVAAQLLNAGWCSSIRQLIQSQSLDGVILSDSNWYGLFPIAVAVDAGIPAYVTMTRRVTAGAVNALHDPASARGILVMPELRLRYMPATIRLRELIATELGPVQQVIVTQRPLEKTSTSTAQSVEIDTDWVETQLNDWCRGVIGTQPQTVESRSISDDSAAAQRETELFFTTAIGDAAQARFRLTESQPDSTSADDAASSESLPADRWPLEYRVICQKGEVRIDDATHLRWRRHNDDETTESLSSDRTAVAVAIDLFARRLAGGLIPTPDLGDVLQALRIQQFAARSRSGEGRLST